MRNKELCQIFEQMAGILEFKGENPFKVNAYRKASRVIGSLSEDLEESAASGRLERLPGVGTAISEKIREYLSTGRLSKYEELRKGVEQGILDLLEIEGLSGRNVATLHRTLEVTNMEDLEQAMEEGKVTDLLGLRDKTEVIRSGLAQYRFKHGERT